MSPVIRSFAVLGTLLAASCAGHPAPSPSAQAIVDSMMQKHPELKRLSVHARPENSTEFHAIASSAADKRGKKSDAEDLTAIRTGEVVVLDEADGAVDVTVPIMMQGGKATAAAGVTMKAPGTGKRDAAVASAKAIANEVAAAMQTKAKP